MEVCGTRGALCGGRARGGEGECPEWPLYPSQANSRKLSRILCCPYSCFEIVKMTKIEKSHFTKKIIRTTVDSVLFPSAVRGLKVSLLRADVAHPRRCLGGVGGGKNVTEFGFKKYVTPPRARPFADLGSCPHFLTSALL